jgi:hypothetical protein
MLTMPPTLMRRGAPDRDGPIIADGVSGLTGLIGVSLARSCFATPHYEFADLITAEMMVGKRIDDEATVTEMFEKTLHLVKKITENSENFIADQLHVWGFEIRPSASVPSPPAP